LILGIVAASSSRRPRWIASSTSDSRGSDCHWRGKGALLELSLLTCRSHCGRVMKREPSRARDVKGQDPPGESSDGSMGISMTLSSTLTMHAWRIEYPQSEKCGRCALSPFSQTRRPRMQNVTRPRRSRAARGPSAPESEECGELERCALEALGPHLGASHSTSGGSSCAFQVSACLSGEPGLIATRFSILFRRLGICSA